MYIYNSKLCFRTHTMTWLSKRIMMLMFLFFYYHAKAKVKNYSSFHTPFLYVVQQWKGAYSIPFICAILTQQHLTKHHLLFKTPACSRFNRKWGEHHFTKTPNCCSEMLGNIVFSVLNVAVGFEATRNM